MSGGEKIPDKDRPRQGRDSLEHREDEGVGNPEDIPTQGDADEQNWDNKG